MNGIKLFKPLPLAISVLSTALALPGLAYGQKTYGDTAIKTKEIVKKIRAAEIAIEAKRIVNGMTLNEKVGQKIMMAFAKWCEDDTPCTTPKDLTTLPVAVSENLRSYPLGGVILFASNLENLDQSAELVKQFKNTRRTDREIDLFIGIDQEGGNVFRLPRTKATSLPGNMALGAAYEGTKKQGLSLKAGQVLASEMAALGMNVNFAPVVDVNSNPKNPVINVRAYGDDPATISLLAQRAAKGMADQGVVGVFKHYPGHGDTEVDSHTGLPSVNKSRSDAEKIDLAPYREAISAGHVPDMIMTAHIQYPALDPSSIATAHGDINTPATLSRQMMQHILREQLQYRGVTITDALNMQAITRYFSPEEAVIKAFQAGVDIALMPVSVERPADLSKLTTLINNVANAVTQKIINEREFNQSVTRIVKLKLKRCVTPNRNQPWCKPTPNLGVIGSADHRDIEREITQKSTTVLMNNEHTLPLQDRQKKIFILTPWGEQAHAIKTRFVKHGYQDNDITTKKLSETTWEDRKREIEKADIMLFGTLSSKQETMENTSPPKINEAPSRSVRSPLSSWCPDNRVLGSLVFNVAEDACPTLSRVQRAAAESEAQQIRSAMEYAKEKGKTIIHISLRAPYDIVNYDDLADATVATYSYYGDNNDDKGLRGPAMPALVDVLVGEICPIGKLPVTISAEYPRGSGVEYPSACP